MGLRREDGPMMPWELADRYASWEATDSILKGSQLIECESCPESSRSRAVVR